jgi:hypothetical protein
MGKIEDLLEATKLNNLLHRNEIKQRRKIGKVFIGVGIAAGVLIIAYVVYRLFKFKDVRMILMRY